MDDLIEPVRWLYTEHYADRPAQTVTLDYEPKPLPYPGRTTIVPLVPASALAGDLIERYAAQVRVARVYAIDAAKGAPTSTFEIMVQHFAGFEAEFASALAKVAALAADLDEEVKYHEHFVAENEINKGLLQKSDRTAAALRTALCKVHNFIANTAWASENIDDVQAIDAVVLEAISAKPEPFAPAIAASVPLS